MTDRPAPELDPAALLGTFERHGVAFVAVGGFAALLYGAERATKDVDLCVEWSADNLERVAGALRDLDARLKLIGYVEVPIDAALLDRMEIATWRTSAGDVDVLLGIPRNSRWELARYEELLERSMSVALGSVEIAVASLDDIIRSKEIANRPNDRDALPSFAVSGRGRRVVTRPGASCVCSSQPSVGSVWELCLSETTAEGPTVRTGAPTSSSSRR